MSLFAWMLLTTVAFAEEPAPPVPVSDAPAASAPTGEGEASASAQPSKKRGKRVEVKETEGTQALDRFEADTILKSQYYLNGQSLEVDPD